MRAPILLAVLLLCSGCGEGAGLRIGAASSVTEVAEEVARRGLLEAEIVAAGTPALIAQVREGARFDVLLTADRRSLAAVAGTQFSPFVFATNTLVVAFPVDNPGSVASLSDLALPSLAVGLGAPGVPVGDYARAALAEARITLEPDTLEPSARALLSKLELGELDAAIVYRTDVADRPLGWIPIQSSIVPEYWALQLSDEGAAFVGLLTSEIGVTALREAGFGVAG